MTLGIPGTLRSAPPGAKSFATLRQDFPLLDGAPDLHYLDSAATTQKPYAVLDALRAYYERDNANPHRGAYALSSRATARYHEARERVARFFGVRDSATLIFTRGTTEALNLVATAWGFAHVAAGDEIVVTGLEHHANFVPWQQLAIAKRAALKVCPITAEGLIDLDRLVGLVSTRTRVVAFSHVSNALGTINPVAEIAAIARQSSRGRALVVCDGAQAAPHLDVRIDDLDVDFYAFSGHKMLGPMGVGALVGRRHILERMPPYQLGGDMIEIVDDERSTWNVLPHKFEAGTPNVADAIGFAAACDYLEALGMTEVRDHEQMLLAQAHAALLAVPGVRLHGPTDLSLKSAVVSFTLDGVHPHDIATVLDQDGVCVRAGHHCAQPLMRRLQVPATARASFYVYNNEQDVRALANGVRKARDMFR